MDETNKEQPQDQTKPEDDTPATVSRAQEPAALPGTRQFKLDKPAEDLKPGQTKTRQTERADAMHGVEFTGTESSSTPGDKAAVDDLPGTRKFKMEHPEEDLKPGTWTPRNLNKPDAMHEAAGEKGAEVKNPALPRTRDAAGAYPDRQMKTAQQLQAEAEAAKAKTRDMGAENRGGRELIGGPRKIR